jgi:predicted TIM-barrel fold metal-dependent hydrolase
MQEGGFWWVIDFMLRADEFYLDHPGDIALVERKLAAGQKYLERLPSDYVRAHFRFSTQPMCKPKSSEHMKWLLEITSAEQLLLYSSDWPHATFDSINWLFETPALSDPAREAILSGNARRLFTRLNAVAAAQPAAELRAPTCSPPSV